MATKHRHTLRPKTRIHAARPDDGDAFIPDVTRTHGYVADDTAEAFGEEVIAAITSAEYVAGDAADEATDDDVGAAFLEALADLTPYAYEEALETELDRRPRVDA